MFVVAIFLFLCCSSGLLAFAKYFDCDPLKSKVIFVSNYIAAKVVVFILPLT